MPPKKAPSGPPVPSGEIGSSGLRQSHGFLHEEFDRKLRGRRGVEVFREMRDNSAPAGAALHAIEIVIKQVETEVLPFSDQKEDVERAAFLESCLHDMSFSWVETRAEHLTMIPYGFAPSEIVYKRRLGWNERGSISSKHDDGRLGWAKIALRAQETIRRWDLDEQGGIRGFWQLAPPKFSEQYIPIEKALLMRVTKERNNPEGRSLLRSAHWPYYCSKRLTEIMLIGAERDLAGLAVVRVPGKLMSDAAQASEKAVYEQYKAIARNVRRGEQEGVVLPSDRPEGGQHYFYDLQLLSTGGRREFDVPSLVTLFDRWILTVMLADMLMMGHQAVGSYALAEGKESLFGKALNGYLETIQETYNQHAVPRLMRLNGWPAERSPRIKHREIAPENLAALADFLSKLQAAGMTLFPDPVLDAHLRKRASLPPKAASGRPRAAADPTPPPDEGETEARRASGRLRTKSQRPRPAPTRKRAAA